MEQLWKLYELYVRSFIRIVFVQSKILRKHPLPSDFLFFLICFLPFFTRPSSSGSHLRFGWRSAAPPALLPCVLLLPYTCSLLRCQTSISILIQNNSAMKQSSEFSILKDILFRNLKCWRMDPFPINDSLLF